MLSLRLLEVAAQAEILRWKQEARRWARNAAMMAGAGLFGLFALALLHIAAWVWLAEHTGPAAAALWVMLADLVIAAVLYFLGRSRRDPVAAEAVRVRQRALEELRAGTVLGDVVRLARRRHPGHELGGMLAESLARTVGRR